MLTLDQIKNVTFTRSRGGYKTIEVDEFIDQCADTVASLIAERDTSNKKLEVLADKLVEYRNDEDSIRSALLSAQRLGDTIVREANQKAALIRDDANIKAEKILKDAEVKAQNSLLDISDEVKQEQAELARLRHEISTFKERMLSIYKEHLTMINMLPEEPKPAASTPVAEPEKAEEPAKTVQIAEEPVDDERSVKLFDSNASVEPLNEEPVAEKETAEEQAVPLMTLPDDNETDSEKKQQVEFHQSRFGELKFGENYDISEDTDQTGESKGLFRRKK